MIYIDTSRWAHRKFSFALAVFLFMKIAPTYDKLPINYPWNKNDTQFASVIATFLFLT